MKAKGDFQCPMCRLYVSVVTSDLSRGRTRSDQEQIESRVPRRPAQGLCWQIYSSSISYYLVGVFPFNFDDQLGAEAEAQPVAMDTSQAVRRSERPRRRNTYGLWYVLACCYH